MCVCMHVGHQECVYIVCIAPLNEIIRCTVLKLDEQDNDKDGDPFTKLLNTLVRLYFILM